MYLQNTYRIHCTGHSGYYPRECFASAGRVRLEVFDIEGRNVQTLVNEYRSAGAHMIRWEPHAHPSGSYVLRLLDGTSQSVFRCCFVR